MRTRMSDARDKPDVPLDPAAVVKGAKRAIHGPDDPAEKFADAVEEYRRHLLELPQENFVAGVQAERMYKEGMCPHDGKHPLGPWIEPPKPPTREVGGIGRYLLFPDFLADWFDQQTPETLAAYNVLARKQIRKTIFNQIIKENWLKATAVGGFAAGCVQYGSQIVEWVVKNLPAIRGAWQLIRAGSGQ